MSSLFRSELMSLCQLFVQPEAVYLTVAELGEVGVAQFKDLNEKVMSRKYIAEVRRIDEMERRLEIINRELVKDEIELPEVEDEPRHPNTREIIDLEAFIEKSETEIKDLSENFSQLIENQRGFLEYRCVLERAEFFFAGGAPVLPEDRDDDENRQLHFVTGIIDTERFHGFERMLWRVTHGNIFVKQSTIDEPFKDPKNGKEISKMVFVAFFQGDQIQTKVKKVCEGYRATVFPCPDDAAERFEIMTNLNVRLADMDLVINSTNDHRQRVLNSAAKSYNDWSIIIKKLKAIYHTMNLFSMDVSQKFVVGECWVPTADLHLLQQAVAEGSKGSTVQSFINVIGTNESPPTFNRTNKFTSGFQNLIDAYGVASYREVNPAFYTIVTFPFLFSVMYGDMGHGFILSLAGGFLILKEKKLSKIKEEIFNIFFSGRYIILMMGLFSMYSGLIYNDVFSKSMNIFGSSWQINYNVSTTMSNLKLQLNPSEDDLMKDRTYPIGLDPVWQLAPDNKILFLNSFKMKMSIVFGVSHMLFGLAQSVVNYNHFKERSSIILQFVPQVIFLCALFGYMTFMIFFKWMVYNPKLEQRFSPGCAPSVLVSFINMMLFSKTKTLDGCDEMMYPHQTTVQLALVLVAVVCIPWMLIGKPLYTKFTRNNRRFVSEDNAGEIAYGSHDDEPMSEVWMHQAIHTIEYVLGTVSHTASYLRLWALSLAHAQLSEVLWTKLMPFAFIDVPYIGFVFVYIIFYMWSSLTVAILVVIEGLSAFLHTLRLHWVEFMDKFYDGEGRKFDPFSFKTILNDEIW